MPIWPGSLLSFYAIDKTIFRKNGSQFIYFESIMKNTKYEPYANIVNNEFQYAAPDPRQFYWTSEIFGESLSRLREVIASDEDIQQSLIEIIDEFEPMLKEMREN